MPLHKSRKKFAALAAGLFALSVTFMGVAVGASSQPYQAAFNGSPAGPEAMPAAIADFDVQVHSRDPETWFQLEPINAQHGADCAAPPSSHPNTSYEGSVYQCRNHLMTALNSSSYGVIYLTPSQRFDFSSGGSVQWEMSTEQMSTRDWWDIYITPWENNLSVPLISDLSQGVDLQGAPLNGIHIGADNGEGAPILTVIRNGVEQKYQAGWQVPPVGYQVAVGTNESASRQTFKFSILGGRMKFERLASATATALVYWDVAATVPFTSGVVQFGHHSYNPTKDGSGVPGTRHWDNITINPASSFTLIKANQRFTQGGSVSFNQPAPANAYLRFTGICQVSIDGVTVQRAADYDRWNMGYHPEHMSSYFVPIAAGKSSVNVSFSPDGWYQGPCIAKDFSIWSQGGTGGGTIATPTSVPSEPTSTPTSPATVPATPTSVPVQPTATPTRPAATPTSTPPQPTATPTNPPVQPTATPTNPPSTPTAAPTNPPATGGSLNRVSWGGQDWYLHGANLPWYNWGCDFGCASNGGASSSSANAVIDSAFANAKASGVNVIRWWVFPGDPWQITRSADGTPTGVNPAVYTDLDAALALAARHDVYLDLVLFSGPTAIPSSWMTNANHRTKLAEALGPMFARYKNNPRLMTWEIVNEPEFDIWGGRADQASVQAMVRSLAASIHSNSPALVTVGSAMVDGLDMWVGQGLDYYQAHWYDYMQPGNWCARCSDYNTIRATYRLDAPLVIGEFFADSSVDSLQRYEDWYAKGFAGAWSWSLLTDRTNDGMTVDLTAARTFASRHGDVGPRAGSTPPPPTATPTTPPRTATPAPTQPPTQPPSTPTATPTVPAQPNTSFTTNATVSRTKISAGANQKIVAKLSASSAASVLVDIEVYGPNGERVHQAIFENQTVGSAAKSFTTNWSIPRNAAKGTYTVKIGVFSPGWGTLYHWDDRTVTFTVK